MYQYKNKQSKQNNRSQQLQTNHLSISKVSATQTIKQKPNQKLMQV